MELQKTFNKWLYNESNIISRVILETDFPFLRPPPLAHHQYNVISAITYTAQYLVNILRQKKINVTKIINESNINIRQMYRIE
jgi:Tat protein secretion system quality control protein TatD with DNase activity